MPAPTPAAVEPAPAVEFQPGAGGRESTARPSCAAETPSRFAAACVGQPATIRVERAECSYQPRVNGRPTFCNDAPFPGHTFTMVVWGSDRGTWRPETLNGTCFKVKGTVTLFRDKPQIEAKSASQVSAC